MKKTPDFKLVTFTLLLLTGSLCVGRLTAQPPTRSRRVSSPYHLRSVGGRRSYRREMTLTP